MNFSEVTNTITVTAEYAIKMYHVIFELGENGVRTGGGSLAQEITHGEAATAPTVTANAGYVFTSWDTEFNKVSAKLTITAQYTPIYEVAFVLGAGTRTGGGVLSQMVLHGSGAIAPTVEAASGYEFLGWDSRFTNIRGITTIRAQYSPITHSVTFSVGEFGKAKSSILTQEVSIEALIKIPKVKSRFGYRFIGWDNILDDVTEDMTVTAQYEYLIPMIDGEYSISNGNIVDVQQAISLHEGFDVTVDAKGRISGYKEIVNGADSTFGKLK